jgi:hypothetical protein
MLPLYTKHHPKNLTALFGRSRARVVGTAKRRSAHFNRKNMTDRLPAPCEHCGATGIFHGIECDECRGKGYRLMVDGRTAPIRPPPRAVRPPRRTFQRDKA